MRLNEIQYSFKDTMLQPVSGLGEVDADLRGVFVDNHISVEDRLKVYHNNIIGSVSASLRATFPVIEKLVGEDFLKGMARSFIFENPPTSGCLHSYGAGFDDFIRGYKPAAALPYLADVATLEFAINAAYYARDDAAMAAGALAQVPEEELEQARLCLRPSATLIESSYPLMEIKNFCEDENAHDAPDLSQTHETLLMVYRPALEVRIIPLDKDAFFILKQLDNGSSLGESIEKTLEKFSDFDFTVFLQKNIALETFSAL